jgi:AcrR family transcriptional regulator
MPRPKQRTPELRERLVQAALATLTEGGVSGFTTRRVAQNADTSPPAVYEFFGDKAGLVREVFFEGFRLLGARLQSLEKTDEPRTDLVAVLNVCRVFARENSDLAMLMFSRPFVDFDPGPSDRKAGAVVREVIVAKVKRCIEAGLLDGQPVDVAHVALAVVQGLALQETGGWLGTSKASMDRRWNLAVSAVLDGLNDTAASMRLKGERK